MGFAQRLRGVAIDGYLGGKMVDLRRRWHRLSRRGRRSVYYFHRASDPYSHLLAQLLATMADHVPVDIHFTVVPEPEATLDAEPQLRQRHALSDALCIASRYRVEFPTAAALPSVPAIDRANAILLADRPAAEQLAVAKVVGDALWSQTELEGVARRYGCIERSKVEPTLARNAATQRRMGHYQGAMIAYEGEWYWGPDRLHYLEDRLRAEGLDVPTSLVVRESCPTVVSPTDVEPTLDMYMSFRSPYSYLALERTSKLARRYGVQLRLLPVVPMVMRGFDVPSSKRMYIARDAAREAQRLGVPFGRICDPIGGGVERCLAVFGRIGEAELKLAFTESAIRGIWAEALDVNSDRDMAVIVRRAGLDWLQVRTWFDDEGWRAKAERNRLELRSLGLWGVPSFHFLGHAVWGQDRLFRIEELLAAWRRLS